MKKYISLVLLLSYTNSMANCNQPVYSLTEGQTSPCSGFLFSPEKESEIRKDNEDYKLLIQADQIKDQQINDYKLQVNDLKDSNKLLEQKSQLWQDRAVQSTEKLMQVDDNKGRRDLLMIITGVGLTVLSGWALGQLGKRI